MELSSTSRIASHLDRPADGQLKLWQKTRITSEKSSRPWAPLRGVFTTRCSRRTRVRLKIICSMPYATPTSMLWARYPREAAADPPLLMTNEYLPFRSDFTER